MQIELIYIMGSIILLVVGLGLGLVLQRKLGQGRLQEAEQTAKQLVASARKEAETLRKEATVHAKDAMLQAKAAWEEEARESRKELLAKERRQQQKEENLDRKTDQLDQRDEDLQRRERQLGQEKDRLKEQQEEVQQLVQQQQRRLEELSGMTADQAKAELIHRIESQARHDAARLTKQIEDEAREKAEKEAKKILSVAVQRYAGDFVAEKTVSTVPLPSDEMKGRIIGREGRNIRAIEAATGIDLIIDDTPEAVVISGFNPVRREVARLTLERLIADGRIHPARIEEVVAKAEEEVNKSIQESGEQATFDLGIHGLHPELVKLIGRLRYRTSYGQNILQHSIEVGFLCGMMAGELGLNVKQARRAGLLHDIGKAVDHEVEGSHAVIGGDLARKYGENPPIVHAIAAHHEDEKPETILALLVQAADALSGARPGARRETLESYVKRLQDLETIGTSFSGVTDCFAIQAGREIRVMVASEEISDAESHVLAKDIARKIEDEMTYPGQIRVNVIRETRAVHYAR